MRLFGQVIVKGTWVEKVAGHSGPVVPLALRAGFSRDGFDRFRDQKLPIFDRDNCYPGGVARPGRPRQYQERRATLTLRLDPDLKERATVIATDRHLSLNQYLVELLDRAVQRAERKENH